MVTLVQVEADDVRLDRLLQLYVHEWSALIPLPIGADARYVYEDLPAWRDPLDHAAFLFLADGRPVGFALVARDALATWHVEEFFVIAGARRHGHGVAAARAVLAARPGAWSFTVRPENPGALAFWRRAVPEATTEPEHGDDGVTRTRFRLVVAADRARPGS